MRIIVFWGLYWGPLILGNYHIASGNSTGRGDLNPNLKPYMELLSKFIWGLPVDH